MSNTEQSRVEFEEWYLSLHGSTQDDLITFDEDDFHIAKGDYYDLGARMMHQAWQARDNEIVTLRDEVDHYRNQLDLACKDTLTPADAKKIKEANAQFANENFELRDEVGRLKDQLSTLAITCNTYRYLHDLKGSGHIETGRAWDLMRREGRKSIELLSK